MTTVRRLLTVLVALALVAVPAAAHVPEFAADNTSPERAHAIAPATTSHAVYDTLAAGQVRYYELNLAAGDRLTVSLFTPDGGAFAPSLAVLAPDGEQTDAVPDRVTVPDGYEVTVDDGERAADPSFEPFTPAANYEVAAHSRRVPEGGRYLVAVYEPSGRAGQVGVAAGDRESFTPVEFVSVAWTLPRVYLWGGTHPIVVVGPALAVVGSGLGLVSRRLGGIAAHPSRTALAIAGSLCIGTAATVFVQTVLALAATGPTVAAALPLALVAVPAALGAAVVHRVTDPAFALTPRDRGFLALAGLLCLGTWAGLVVAPVALLLAAVAPAEQFRVGQTASESSASRSSW